MLKNSKVFEQKGDLLNFKANIDPRAELSRVEPGCKQFLVMFVRFEVQFWAKMMCSKFDPLKFEVFEVQFFDVRSTSINDHLDLITTLTIGHQLLQRVTKVTKAEVPFLFCYLNSPSLSPFK